MKFQIFAVVALCIFITGCCNKEGANALQNQTETIKNKKERTDEELETEVEQRVKNDRKIWQTRIQELREDNKKLEAELERLRQEKKASKEFTKELEKLK